MAEYPRLVQTGTVNGIAIMANANGDGFRRILTVTLTANYLAIDPGGWPTRPPTGCAPELVWTPGLVPAGTTRQFFNCEAEALVAAGAAILA